MNCLTHLSANNMPSGFEEMAAIPNERNTWSEYNGRPRAFIIPHAKKVFKKKLKLEKPEAKSGLGKTERLLDLQLKQSKQSLDRKKAAKADTKTRR